MMRTDTAQMSSQNSYLIQGGGEKYESEKDNRRKIMLSLTFRELKFCYHSSPVRSKGDFETPCSVCYHRILYPDSPTPAQVLFGGWSLSAESISILPSKRGLKIAVFPILTCFSYIDKAVTPQIGNR